ncbi:ATP-dependent nuclease [Sharpea azabuensis]|uniref:ATP-dependent nuclease n=1 Tax=Sharpea azabuensis TaxID=322505 RepID=UPI003D061CBF
MDQQNNNIPSVSIERIKFNDETLIDFESDDIVLLVGANNVGKSRTLKDLKDDLNDLCKPKVIVDEVTYKSSNFSVSQLKDYFEKNISKDSFGNYHVTIDDNQFQSFDTSTFTDSMDEKQFYKVLFSFLSTENRLNITKPIIFNTILDNRSLRIMERLDSDSQSINALNKLLQIGFEKSIDTYEEYLDGTIVKKYKVGKSEIINNTINSSRRDSHDSLKAMEDLNSQGDGIRSAFAILASLIVNNHSLFLIDEPETFLHPPQARLLAKNIVSLSEKKQCFISTHNIDFIKGVLEADSSRVKIIKIDRFENKNKFNLVDNNSVAEIANDKNLRYTNILDGLFYDRLVLCENESDCKFYSAILENLDLVKYQNTLFCAVGGKHQFKKVVPLLKKLNIQYAIIADIDLINNKDNLRQLVNSIEDDCYNQINDYHTRFIEEFEEGMNSQIKTQAVIKTEINEMFNSEKYMSDDIARRIKESLKYISSFTILKSGGERILPQGECVTLFNKVKEFLNDHNVFIVECGEIERFVSDVKGHGNDWVEKTFARYNDINNPVYDEAKQFIKNVFDIK